MKWRTCQVFNREWVETEFGAVKKGDIFRLFESDGQPVKGNQGETEFIALKDAVPCEPEDNFSIEVVPHFVREDHLCGRKT